ncbi:MAG: hypothetical protein ACREJ4_06425 [Candidatus Methylomirabilaceae bacterium]
MTFTFGRVSLALVAALLFGCSKPPLGPLQSWRGGPVLDPDQVVSTDGTIRFVAIEGGCWALQTPQGDYEPFNLPEGYRLNGLRVHVVLRGARAGSYCMIAPVVSLDSIRIR